ncbi:MAG: hypothetical protein RIM72_11215 [Alphaproteobacteria bacterium]
MSVTAAASPGTAAKAEAPARASAPFKNPLRSGLKDIVLFPLQLLYLYFKNFRVSARFTSSKGTRFVNIYVTLFEYFKKLAFR